MIQHIEIRKNHRGGIAEVRLHKSYAEGGTAILPRAEIVELLAALKDHLACRRGEIVLIGSPVGRVEEE
jgi:hypothetical protein